MVHCKFTVIFVLEIIPNNLSFENLVSVALLKANFVLIYSRIILAYSFLSRTDSDESIK